MKNIFTIILIVGIFIKSRADYTYMTLSTLVCEADYAAVGTIVHLDESYFYLEVQDYVIGSLNIDTLKIQKFSNWSSGRRFFEYAIGQRELVFFRKSNYVIDKYDLLGYGSGGEFELPIINDSIYYNFRYGELRPYGLSDFLTALKDYSQAKIGLERLTDEDRLLFASKSELHRVFIECEISPRIAPITAPTGRYLANLEKSFLYQDYPNKVYPFGFDIDSIELSVDDAFIMKRDGYFIVKPKEGWTRRWLNIYSIEDTSRSHLLYNQIFEIIELPQPRLFFGGYLTDTIHLGPNAIPTVAHYLDNMHYDNNLKYELLSYDIAIHSGSEHFEYEVNSSNGTPELRSRLQQLEDGDEIVLTNIFVLYPDNSVHQMESQFIIFKREH